eukprot:scaffold20780_cov53-Attheya_sp.AAC.6
MYAFVHPDAKPCSDVVAKLGYEVLIRDTPFRTSDIRGDHLRETMNGFSSCCGAKEYIKLYAYTLLDHPVAVHLDLDSLVLQPLDDLFDAMLVNDGPNDSPMKQRIPVMFDAMIPDRIDAFFTKDYNLINPGDKYPSIQGGFIVVRPNQTIFDEYIDIVLEGNFVDGLGWGGKYGWSWGGRQIQGICAYMFGEKYPNKSVELNRCVYNNMADDPRMDEADPNTGLRQCKTLQDECQDCRETPITEIKLVHFTICGKPWKCSSDSDGICTELHHEWFRMRKDFESWRSPLLQHNGTKDITEGPPVSGTYRPEVFHGFCSEAGDTGYIPLII